MSDEAAPPVAAVRFNENHITAFAAAGILLHVILRYVTPAPALANLVPLYLVLALGGVPLAAGLAAKVWAREFGPTSWRGSR